MAMKESGYYPMGTEFRKDAPWNEVEIPEKEFDVSISQSLSKSVKVNTCDYYLEAEDPEDKRSPMMTNTSETDWEKAYSEEHMTPLELINKFKRLLIDTKDAKEEGLLLGCDPNHKSIDYLIEECSNWIEDETEVIEE